MRTASANERPYFSIFHVIGFPSEPIGKNKKAPEPEADEDAKSFTVCAVLFFGSEPGKDGGEESKGRAEEERKLGGWRC